MDENLTKKVFPNQMDPDTDPSALTTQALWREIAHLKELVITKIHAIEKGIEVAHDDLVRVPTEVEKGVSGARALYLEKFDAASRETNEKFNTVHQVALEKFAQTMSKFKDIGNQFDERYHLFETKFANVDKQFTERYNLFQGKFDGVEKQFLERDERANLIANSAAKAIEAALISAKAAVDKQNEAFQLSINKSEASTTKQIDQLATLVSTLTKGFDDKLNDLKDRITRNEGSDSGKKEKETTSSLNWGIVFGAVGMVGGIIATIVLVMKLHS